jgi:hypothetical protein
MNRHRMANATFYDTETTLTLERIYQLAQTFEHIGNQDLAEIGRLLLTDNTVCSGNEWFAKFREFANVKKKNAKEFSGTLPFVDKHGKPIKALLPSLFEVDSLSMFTTDSVEAIYDKNNIGDSGANTDALRSAAAKNQMLMQIPTLTGSSNSYMVTTAHVGDKHQLDPYAPQVKKLAFLKGSNAFKNVPEKFTFLTNNLWYCHSTQVLQNQTTKGPEYPAGPDDDLKGDTDLQLLTLQNLRAKAGPTGMPFELVISQREGVLVGLSEFNYIKSFNRYGLGGHDRAYYLELCPDVSMQRTTVRSKINENPTLQRALEITSELCQMENLVFLQAQGKLCTPKELFEDIKKLGYDWDEILEGTRGYWTFRESPEEKKFLSTMDLLNMRQGTYKPYWKS